MTDEQKLNCGEILRYYGEAHQQEKSIEEMAELISAIKHGDRENYIEELADCMVMNEQLFQALTFEEQQRCIVVVHEKIARQLKRIKEDKTNGNVRE